MKWNLADIINEVAYMPDRPLEKRDYVYASELGGCIKDRLLRMNAVPYTSPPNERSRGKFLVGHIWQHTFEVILKVAGLYKESETKINSTPYSNTLPVHGKCDIIAGAFDKEIALENLKAISIMVPDQLIHKIKGVIEKLGGLPLETKILEIKSVSEYVVEKVSIMKHPLKTHGLQGYYYGRVKGLPSSVFYISKNDNFSAEAEVTADPYENLMRDDLERITHYFLKGEEPPPEPKLWFNNLTGKFEKNIQIEYSPYIQLHGYNSPYDFRQEVEPKVKKWNDAVKRFINIQMGGVTPTGKPVKMTPGAEEAQKEIITAGYDFDAIIEAKKRFTDEPETEIEE